MSANRNNYYLENMAGMFVSTLPILLNYSNSNSSFESIIKNNMNILFDINNNNDNYENIFDDNNEDNDDKFFNMLLENSSNNYIRNSKFDITFFVIENENDYTLTIEYDSNKYNESLIENILKCFVEMSKQVNNYHENINKIEYIPSDEIHKVLHEFNSDMNTFDENKCYYYEDFNEMAMKYPEKCAVICNNIEISYKQLNEMTNSLGHYLRSVVGVDRNDIIPIISDRSPYYIIGTVGISKSGAAYLPIDKHLPLERIQFILDEVNPKIILFHNSQSLIDKINESNNNKYESYDLVKHDFSINCNQRVMNINKPDDTCYVLFTSGTTGKPKGTLVSHFNIYNYLKPFENDKNDKDKLCFYNLIKHDNVSNILGITNFSFDIAHNEIAFVLVHGLTCVLVDEEVSENMSLLGQYIINKNVDLINTTPTRFKLFMENNEFNKSLERVKSVVFSGEELPLSLCKNIHQLSNCKIYNGYGPTECYFCTFKEINEEKESHITIGKPISNEKIYILDKYLRPLPIGVEGEIYIGGYGVGKGYLNHEELTKEKFIENPFNENDDEHNKIMYRTGDLGKWTESGEIDYLGRIDFQVKIHGQRIELGEIENTIKNIDGIEHSVVIDKKKESGDKYLICYYISDKEMDSRMIRDYLKGKLPAYMIPHYIKRIHEIPLSNSGKLNRKALPEPDINDMIKEEYEAPITDIEKIICKIYSDIFKIPENEVGRTNDFFEMGGDSLNAIRIVAYIKNEFNIKIYIKDIMNNSKIYEISHYINDILVSNDRRYKLELIEKCDRDEFPVSCILSNLNIDYKDIENNQDINNEQFKISRNNILLYYKIKTKVDMEKLTHSFNILMNRHKILKTKFISENINGKQKICGKIVEDAKIEIERYTKDTFMELEQPIDITKDLLIRVALIEDDILLIKINHFISDGYSYGILINELFKIYNDEVLEDLPIQYSDFAYYYDNKINSENYSEHIEFYSSIFDVPFNNVTLPSFISNDNNKKIIKSMIVKTDKNVYHNVHRIIKENNISKTTFFLVMYCLVISAYSGQDNLFINMFNSNRTNTFTEKLIGYFVKYTPLLIKLENTELIQFLHKYKNLLISLFSYDVPYSVISNELNLPVCNLSFKFDPFELYSKDEFNYLENIDRADIYKMFGKDYLSYNEIEIDQQTNSNHLSFTVTERENHYDINLTYYKGVYEENLLESVINNFIDIISNENILNMPLLSIIKDILNKNNISIEKDIEVIKSIPLYENSSENTEIIYYNENANENTELIFNNTIKISDNMENHDENTEIIKLKESNTNDEITETTYHNENTLPDNSEVKDSDREKNKKFKHILFEKIKSLFKNGIFK
ncbi:hypothetical protein PIROE2DRAFT_9446 [Piromyces sp. E2]|nr:hypothetical protein PIROE2DRAFT_9446 [Piromyces sp. E2]|eukprot:OUM63915.1 hypothetical protein PIROE2DRAFT_9446 [Piromyces sp. E2]